ncbi:MAG TPA: hypothetical protein VJQ44_11185 [Gemmatimonadales bacterium]|nr:hypothetical protein [Gemmatimonadales bacterium]
MQVAPQHVTIYGLAALLGLGTTRAAAAQAAAPGVLSDASAVIEVAAAQRTVHKAKAPHLSAEAVWVPGFWDLRADPRQAPRAGWVWVPGRWLEPPVPGAEWDEGHWDWDRGWYTWIPSHWVVPERRGYPTTSSDDAANRFEMSAP